MRNISIRMPEEPLKWIDEQIKKFGRFGSRADVFREALAQFIDPTMSVEIRKIADVREEGGVLIETAKCHDPFFVRAKDTLFIDNIESGRSRLIIMDFIEPRKILVKICSRKASKVFLLHEKQRKNTILEQFSPEGEKIQVASEQ